jgi:hypothetical protein
VYDVRQEEKNLQDAPVSQNRNTALEPVQERKYIYA